MGVLLHDFTIKYGSKTINLQKTREKKIILPYTKHSNTYTISERAGFVMTSKLPDIKGYWYLCDIAG